MTRFDSRLRSKFRHQTDNAMVRLECVALMRLLPHIHLPGRGNP